MSIWPAVHPHGISETVVRAILGKLAVGELALRAPDGTVTSYRAGEPGPTAEVWLRDPRAMRRVLLGGGIGLAEGYMAGEWDTPDLPAVLDLGLANLNRLPSGSLPTPARPIHRFLHRVRENTRSGARRNIAYHYDLGNDFYELWLDDTMTYSCALFESQDEDRGGDAGAGPERNTPARGDAEEDALACAQRRKWARLLELLQPSRSDHLLEIGCGWGGFAMYAAREAGCRVTGITISEAQRDLARRRVREAGLDGQVEIRLQDYRDLADRFSGIASIEMFEAVGERYWPVFFGRIRELLADGGRAAVQSITILEERFEAYRSRPDFTQLYIFPGGMLPSPERFVRAAAAQGLKTASPKFFGPSYARTLERWLERFDDVRDEVMALGFDERFVRMWRYYLAYCRAGFAAGNVNVMQVALEPAGR